MPRTQFSHLGAPWSCRSHVSTPGMTANYLQNSLIPGLQKSWLPTLAQQLCMGFLPWTQVGVGAAGSPQQCKPPVFVPVPVAITVSCMKQFGEGRVYFCIQPKKGCSSATMVEKAWLPEHEVAGHVVPTAKKQRENRQEDQARKS